MDCEARVNELEQEIGEVPARYTAQWIANLESRVASLELELENAAGWLENKPVTE